MNIIMSGTSMLHQRHLLNDRPTTIFDVMSIPGRLQNWHKRGAH